jgi:hypothetical protein
VLRALDLGAEHEAVGKVHACMCAQTIGGGKTARLVSIDREGAALVVEAHDITGLQLPGCVDRDPSAAHVDTPGNGRVT